MFGFLRKRRRHRLRRTPVSAEWRAIAERNVPLFRNLPAMDRTELLGHVQVLLAEKHFEGCGGLHLSDEVRVTIAVQASLLLLHRDTDYFPRLTSILVYPSEYVVQEERHLGGGIWDDEPEDRLGHTHDRMRAMVLAWDAVMDGAADPADGENLVLHEFAHQLDFEDASTDGTPALDSRLAYADWTRVMEEELSALREAEARGESTVLDSYGATDPAEFFAVATETFFERPRALRERHPSLYAELQRYYRQDPVSYSAE